MIREEMVSAESSGIESGESDPIAWRRGVGLGYLEVYDADGVLKREILKPYRDDQRNGLLEAFSSTVGINGLKI